LINLPTVLSIKIFSLFIKKINLFSQLSVWKFLTSPVTNETNRHDITDILLKVALNTKTLTLTLTLLNTKKPRHMLMEIQFLTWGNMFICACIYFDKCHCQSLQFWFHNEFQKGCNWHMVRPLIDLCYIYMKKFQQFCQGRAHIVPLNIITKQLFLFNNILLLISVKCTVWNVNFTSFNYANGQRDVPIVWFTVDTGIFCVLSR
jgi:hypothetical protein